MDSALPMPPLWVATDAALSARARARRGDALVTGVGVDSLSQTLCALASSHLRPSSGSLTKR